MTSGATTAEELASFRAYVESRLAESHDAASLDDLYDQWRLEHPVAGEIDADAKAIEASLRDMRAGETGQDFSEFRSAFRARNGLPADS